MTRPPSYRPKVPQLRKLLNVTLGLAITSIGMAISDQLPDAKESLYSPLEYDDKVPRHATISNLQIETRPLPQDETPAFPPGATKGLEGQPSRSTTHTKVYRANVSYTVTRSRGDYHPTFYMEDASQRVFWAKMETCEPEILAEPVQCMTPIDFPEDALGHATLYFRIGHGIGGGFYEHKVPMEKYIRFPVELKP